MLIQIHINYKLIKIILSEHGQKMGMTSPVMGL